MKKSWIVLLLAVLLAGCEAENLYTKDYLCRFTFFASMHPESKLLTALDPLSTGVFARVSAEQRQGVWHLKVNLNDDKTSEDLTLSLTKENQISYDLGANNALIIGYSAFSGLKAYDRQCPNCLDSLGGYNYPLNWTHNGQWVECAKCNRQYALENGTVMSGNGGRQLLEYRASYNQTMLTVYN